MNVLALDLGTHTGWALSEGGRIESGVQVFDVKRGESPGMRYVRFRRWLQEVAGPSVMKGATPVDMIVYEQTHHRGGAATEVAAGFSTRVQECCAEWLIAHAAVHTATIKKFATGKGNAKKPDMLAAAYEHGWAWPSTKPWDDNEIDALALVHYALAEIVPASGSASAPERSEAT